MVAENTVMDPETFGGVASTGGSDRGLRLLAYVHMRNIYASTGAGRVARQLVEHLAQDQSIQLRILADAADKSRVLPVVGGAWADFRYETFASDTSRQQARWFALGRPAAEEFWAEADLVWCAGESYVPTRKAKLAVTAHDAAYFEPDAHEHNQAFWKQRLKWKLLFARLSSRADMIHTVSQFSAERLAHFFPALQPRIRVVPNAVAPLFFTKPLEEHARTVEDLHLGDRPYVLVPGGLSYRKNAELILKAAPLLLERFPDLVLIISGNSDEVYAERARKLHPRLRLTGFIGDSLLHGLYSGAIAVWFPSRYEGFGMPVLEAMASGAPVVASNASSIPEIVGKAALLAEASNCHDHLEKVTALITDSGLRGAMRQSGLAQAARFTWNRSATQLKRCFLEVL